MSIQQFWIDKTPKEKTLLVLGAVVVVFGLAYHLLYKPFNEKLESTQNALESDRALLQWMQENERAVKRTRGQTKPKSNVPLFQMIESAFSPLQEDDDAPRISRLDDNRVSVSFQKVAFDKLMKTLEQVVNKQGLVVSNFSAKKSDEQGYAIVNFTLSSESAP